jgi:hypothetical protein
VVADLFKPGKTDDETRETLELLNNLAEARAALCEREIIDDLNASKTGGGSLSFPVENEMERQRHYGCVMAENKENVLTALKDRLRQAFRNPGAATMLNGLAGAFNDLFSMVTGVAEGSEDAKRGRVVTVDAIGLIRFDYAVWCRKLRVLSLKTRAEMAVSCVYVRSVVDISKISFNAFAQAFAESCFPLIGLESGALSLAQRKKKMDECLDHAEALYNRLSGKQSAAPAQRPPRKGGEKAKPLTQKLVVPKSISLPEPVVDIPQKAFRLDSADIPINIDPLDVLPPDINSLDLSSIDIPSIDFDALPEKPSYIQIDPHKW